MSPGDVARLLAACAMYDYRAVEAEDAEAWFPLIGDLDFEDAMESVRRHYQSLTDRMMPAHVRQGVKAIREERRRREPSEALQLPSRFEEDMGRQVRLERGAASARQVLGPLLEHLAEKSGRAAAVTALDELRAITPGPDWSEGEAS